VAAPDPSVTQQAVTFTATVAPVAASAVPSGTVTFTVDGADVVTKPLDASGTASLTTSALAAGQHSVTATYNGDANLLQRTSGVSNQTVDKQATAVTLTSSKNPSVLGDPIVFTATMAPPDATGTIDFLVDAGVISVPIINGSASFTTSALALGGHTITARYNGDAIYKRIR